MKLYIKGVLRNTIFVSLRGAKRRSNLVLSSENKIAAPPFLLSQESREARNDTFWEFRNRPIKGQAVLEIALSLICVFILLFGSLNVFLWINKKIVHSREDYESSRVEAGDNNPGKQVDETDKTRYPDLEIFENHE